MLVLSRPFKAVLIFCFLQLKVVLSSGGGILDSRKRRMPTSGTAGSKGNQSSLFIRRNTLNPAIIPRGGDRDTAYIVGSLFAGVGSGALASTACAPLDLIRTRLQVWGDLHKGKHTTIVNILSDTLKKEGWKGYFRGLGATLATVPLFWGLYFPLYDELKRRFEHSRIFGHPSLIHCASAISAGCFADVVCNPMFVVRTRMQTEALHDMVGEGISRKQHGILQTISVLYKEGGVPVFWRGLTASLMGLSHVAIQFPVYEYLKKEARIRSKNNEESAMDLLFASGMSKITASLITYPHEVVRSRMMDARQSAKLGETIRRIAAEEGVSGFYSGLHVSLLRVIPNCCITFMTYEMLLRFAKQQINKQHGEYS
mmetsp:Transcript_23796/g.31018  ORF Transcript_23796/g.31018 Transcript_23796/m.31018 type:complete len:370 (+) Transcript_23796:64-1173(+)